MCSLYTYKKKNNAKLRNKLENKREKTCRKKTTTDIHKYADIPNIENIVLAPVTINKT